MQEDMLSVMEKRIPSVIVYYNCSWYSFFGNGCYTCLCFLKPWSIIISYRPLFFKISIQMTTLYVLILGEKKKEKHCVGPDPFGCSSQLHPTHCGCFCKQMARNYGFCFHIRSTYLLSKNCFYFLTTDTYTKSLVNTNLVNTNFTNTHFQKVPIPHLTRTMKQKFLH